MKQSNILVYKLSSDHTTMIPVTDNTHHNSKRKNSENVGQPPKRIRKKRAISDSDDSDDDSNDFKILNTSNSNIADVVHEPTTDDTGKDDSEFLELIHTANDNAVSEDNMLWNDYHFNSKDIREFNLLKNNSFSISNSGNLCTIEERTLWTSATSLKNFMLNDPIIDWLKMYYDANMITLHNTFFNNNNLKIRKSTRLRTKLERNPAPDTVKKMQYLKTSISHFNKLFENGNAFEEKILDEFRKRVSVVCKDYTGEHKFVKVFKEEDYNEYKRTNSMDIYKKRQKDTLKHMKNGVPIIAQAALINSNNHTFGVADLLIRSDYLEMFFENQEEDDRLYVGAPNISTVYHYRVCDIKWSKFQCNADGVTLRNSGFVPAYKAQLAVYNVALGKLQGYIPPKAYILCKAWHVKSKLYEDSSNDSFNKLCEVDYENGGKYGDGQYIKRTKDAIKWIQRLSLVGNTWGFGCDAPDIPELYPNMCNDNCGEWRKIKKIIADYYEELTRVWYIGVKHRNIAHSKGIYKTIDDRCNCENLQINGTNKHTIDKILDINRSKDPIWPATLSRSKYAYWLNKTHTDYYVDFETFNGVIKMTPNDINVRDASSDNDITFMIGIGFDKLEGVDTETIISAIRQSVDEYERCGFTIVDNNGWEYVCFYMKSAYMEQERSVYEHFMKFFIERNKKIREVYKVCDNKIVNSLFHWTGAEKKYICSLNNRHCDRHSEDNVSVEMVRLCDRFKATCNMVDLFELFRTIPIVVKGSFNFKLKSVTNAMRNNGLITTAWPDSSVMEGFSATLIAAEIYNDIDSKKVNPDELDNNCLYKDIIDYNEIDCKSMWDIRKYLLGVSTD